MQLLLHHLGAACSYFCTARELRAAAFAPLGSCVQLPLHRSGPACSYFCTAWELRATTCEPLGSSMQLLLHRSGAACNYFCTAREQHAATFAPLGSSVQLHLNRSGVAPGSTLPVAPPWSAACSSQSRAAPPQTIPHQCFCASYLTKLAPYLSHTQVAYSSQRPPQQSCTNSSMHPAPLLIHRLPH